MRHIDLPQEEEKTLKFWQERGIFEKTLEATQKGKPFVFFEGPPTANGRPGIHHVLARSFKDIICRFKTMQGYYVERRAGWDTHGLPVEIEVEKKLGLKTKKEVEKFGIARFNRECQKSVWEYKDEWEKLTRRMGFWLDFKNHYATCEPGYIENLWGALKKIWDKKLLIKDYKVVPFCVRCGTPISSHEVAQGYETITDKSVIVKFLITNYKLPNTYFLAWTTTPWTLPGNVALAVGPKILYAQVESEGEKYILAKDLVAKVFAGKDYRITKELKTSELVKLSYKPFFAVKELVSPQSYKVYLADFVSTAEGTGIVHTAVMYGADDFELGSKVGLPKFHTVSREGVFVKSVPVVAGLSVVSEGRKDAVTEKAILFYLKKQNLLFNEAEYMHEYPFCWRCKSPLLYYAMESWFIKMSALRKELITNNSKINWVPEHLKEGRFGEWLREVKDWALSRERYWGTPLPIWECSKCDRKLVAGSLEDLNTYRADAPTTLILMRHGEAESNVKKIYSSYPEKGLNPLTEKGRKDVLAAAKKIRSQLAGGKVAAIYSSDLLRTRETAQILADEFKIKNIIFDERLREIDAGEFNGRSAGEEDLGGKPGWGESWADVLKRMRSFAAEVYKKHAGKTVLVISHGDPLYLLRRGRTDGAMEDGENYLGVAGFAEFKTNNWPYDEDGNLNLHRPYADKITLKCPKCSGKMNRVKDLADVWFDSGAMPWASQPRRPEGSGLRPQASEKLPKDPSIKLGASKFPADYICEAIDQTRGWFYTLLAVSTALGEGAPYKNVISLNHVLDEKGEKMSKSRGNIVDPWWAGGQVGFDMLRWYFYTVNAPGDNKLFNLRDLETKKRRFADTLVNSYLFLETYHQKPPTSLSVRPDVLDKWILARLESVTAEVISSLDRYDITSAARNLEEFVDDLSNWYIRRSRRRFQKQTLDGEKLAAQNTLTEVLKHTAILLAPFTPFLAEWLYGNLRDMQPLDHAQGKQATPRPRSGQASNKESVHLEKYSKISKPKKSEVVKIMDKARELVALGLAERARAGIRVRQPLNALYVSPSDYKMVADVTYVISEELNVKKVLTERKLAKDTVSLDTELTAELKEEGLVREMIRNINEMRKEAKLTPEDKIILHFDFGSPSMELRANDLKRVLNHWEEAIKTETRATQISTGQADTQTFLIHKIWNYEGYEIGVGVRRD